MAKRKKLTAMKVASGLGAATGAAVFLSKSGLGDDAVLGAAMRGDLASATKNAFTNPNFLPNSQRQTGALVSGVIAAGVPPLAVALVKKVQALVRSF